jgi:glutamine amidotransferase-like uncharacterized protein
MKNILKTLMVGALIAVSCPTELVAKQNEKACKEVLSRGAGYYKEVFMDAGIYLTSRTTLYASELLGASMECFSSADKTELTKVDTLLQTKIMCGSEEDTNGWLLYPDGAPRYRMIYMNGGKARHHANSLTEVGRERLRQFVNGGGSYVGTCAGAFFASRGWVSPQGDKHNNDVYLKIYPGLVGRTYLYKTSPAVRVEKKSPLLNYFDFGKDLVVEEVYHNGGCYLEERSVGETPQKAEILARYIFKDTNEVQIDNKPVIWAIKESAERGRVVSSGSHPEKNKEGEQRDLMAAMMVYAMDGNAAPRVKGELEAGKERLMYKRTEDDNPMFTRIGDRQYHHFVINVPEGCQQAVVTLKGVKGEDNFDLTLCATRKELAFCENALVKNNDKGCNKSLVIEKPKAGKWYVSVLCETTVTSTMGKYGTEYSGRTDVLNGVPYSVQVDYK